MTEPRIIPPEEAQQIKAWADGIESGRGAVWSGPDWDVRDLAHTAAVLGEELRQSDFWLVAAIAWDAGHSAALRNPDESNPYAAAA